MRIEELYKTTNDIYEKLGKMESTLADVHSEVKRTNGRVTHLEQWTWKAFGILAAIVFIANFFREQIVNYLK